MSAPAVCLDCGLAPGTLRCAAAVAGRETCDKPLCDQCAHEVAGRHLCHDHERARQQALEGLPAAVAKREPEQGNLF